MKQQAFQVDHEDCTRKVSGHAIPFFLFFGGANAAEVTCQSDSNCSHVLPERTMCVRGEDTLLTQGICQKPSNANIIQIFRRAPQISPCLRWRNCVLSGTRPSQVLAAQKTSGNMKSKSFKYLPKATLTARHSMPSVKVKDDNLETASARTKPTATVMKGETASGNSAAETAHASIGSSVELPVSQNGGMWIGIGVSAVIALLAMGVIVAFTRRVRKIRNAEVLKKDGRYDELPVGFESFSKPSNSVGGKTASSHLLSNASVHSNESTRSDRSFGDVSSTSSVTARDPIFHAGSNQPSSDSSSSRSNNSMVSSKSHGSHRAAGRIQGPTITNGVWTPAREHRRPGTPISKSRGDFHPTKSRSLPSSYTSSSSGSSQMTTLSANMSVDSSSYQTPSLISGFPNPSSSRAASPFLLTEADRIAIAERSKVRMFLHGPN